MITTPKWIGLLAVAFVAGSFVASPELRAYAANTIGSSDIINETILSEDIKNSQIKAADIATDAVGAAEIIGVKKLNFAQCRADNAEGTKQVASGSNLGVDCSISGVDSDDSVLASMNSGVVCFDIQKIEPSASNIHIILENECSTTESLGAGTAFSVIVFDK